MVHVCVCDALCTCDTLRHARQHFAMRTPPPPPSPPPGWQGHPSTRATEETANIHYSCTDHRERSREHTHTLIPLPFDLCVRFRSPCSPLGSPEGPKTTVASARIDVVRLVRERVFYFHSNNLLFRVDRNTARTPQQSHHTRARTHTDATHTHTHTGVMTRGKNIHTEVYPLNKMYVPVVVANDWRPRLWRDYRMWVFVQRGTTSHAYCIGDVVQAGRVSMRLGNLAEDINFSCVRGTRKLKCQVKPDIWLSNDR